MPLAAIKMLLIKSNSAVRQIQQCCSLNPILLFTKARSAVRFNKDAR